MTNISILAKRANPKFKLSQDVVQSIQEIAKS